MKVELSNDGERKTTTVDDYGRVYVGKDISGKEIELAYEVQEE